MAIGLATCDQVEDGDTFKVAGETWMRLARYDAPKKRQPNYIAAKRLFSSLILNKEIVFEQVGTSYDRPAAEVWLSNISINDIMLSSGLNKKESLK